MKRGFTMVELLVVMGIIAVLATMGFGYFANAQKSARNARRIGNVKAYETALEQYYGDNEQYPTGCGNLVGGSNEYFKGDILPEVDRSNCIATEYCVCAELEPVHDKPGNAVDPTTDTSCTFVSTPSVHSDAPYFCVTNLQ